jgi:hypothetical protein
MMVHKCDLCKKEIRKREMMVSVGLSQPFGSFEFCTACGEPILDVLKKKQLIEED